MNTQKEAIQSFLLHIEDLINHKKRHHQYVLTLPSVHITVEFTGEKETFTIKDKNVRVTLTPLTKGAFSCKFKGTNFEYHFTYHNEEGDHLWSSPSRKCFHLTYRVGTGWATVCIC